jgi:hypothetical protein
MYNLLRTGATVPWLNGYVLEAVTIAMAIFMCETLAVYGCGYG